ncbi:unnamed protein product [Ranitomeya imitator]|uniref:phosphopyruvate hydratase n=1 Tax=Ranitomeya imitator TaxID=111125 RepID=A0ABN9MIR9_9NEOB|nr:unnamed protein product [Ranitomeya imitator]
MMSSDLSTLSLRMREEEEDMADRHSGILDSRESVVRSVSSLGCLVLACDRLDQPLEIVRDACQRLGLQPGTDVYLAINCAAHELMDYNRGRYEVVSGTWKSPDEMVDLYVDLISTHAAIIALLDPFRREDRTQWEALGKAVGSRCYLLADTASRSVSDLLQGSSAPVCSGHVLTLANETTVSDLLAAVRLMEDTVVGTKDLKFGLIRLV